MDQQAAPMRLSVMAARQVAGNPLASTPPKAREMRWPAPGVGAKAKGPLPLT